MKKTIKKIQKSLVMNYRDNMWPDFKSLVLEYFGDKYILGDKKFFRWQFKLNPYHSFFPGPYSMSVLKHKEILLGHLGLIPAKLNFFGRIFIKGAFLCNLMVNESCRAFGLGSYLIKNACGNFGVLWGTGHSSKTGPMYEKLGDWKLMGNLNRYIKLINLEDVSLLTNQRTEAFSKTGAMAPLMSLNKNSGIIIEMKKRFDKESDAFIKKILPKYPITVSRDSAYLNWRYADHPYFKYKILLARDGNSIVGYVVFRVAKSSGGKKDFLVGHILDLMAENEAVGPLLVEAERQMTIAGVCLIDYFSTGLFHRDDFIKLGFRRNDKFPFNAIPLYFNPIASTRNGDNDINFLVYYGGKMEYKNELCDINNWYITKGDGDKDRPNPH